MTWTVIVAHSAHKQLAKLPAPERQRILDVLAEMERDPYSGDLKRLTNYGVAFRRRVGVYRILFDLNVEDAWIEVVSIERRGDDTYRRR
jgi:mRNA-degrading endonuclease RelE of RelBE toxin-antitoxin system